jgi:DNA helicase IV
MRRSSQPGGVPTTRLPAPDAIGAVAPVNCRVPSPPSEDFDDVTQEQDVQEEQRFLDRAYEGLESMRAEATRMLQSVLDLGRGGTFQSRTERDIVVRTSMARLAQLDIGDQALCFGRIDRLPEPDQAQGEAFHIGRLAVSGPDHEPLVVDWRAPVAEPFYRATGLDPQGLARRRHLAVTGRTVTGVEDEYFSLEPIHANGDAGAPAYAGNGNDGEVLSLGGPGALLSALSQVRTGRMVDIVATIQREQDEVIRSPLGGVLMVQGGPGTGKTAVALHRAAYLLYTHRFPLERQGVLVVGPNPLFLRYIERVLPSLGETGVTLSTVAGLVPEIRVRSVEELRVARLKGDARMAAVVAKAVRTRQRALRSDLDVPFGAATLRLRASESEQIVAAARRRPGPHNVRRRFVEQQVLQRLAEQYDRVTRRGGAGGAVDPLPGAAEPVPGAADPLTGAAEPVAGVAPTPGGDRAGEGPREGEADLTELRRQIRRNPLVAEALDRMWPRLSPHELVHDLLGARPLLAAAGSGVLSEAELGLLYRPRSASLDQVAWTAADAALVDEARPLLGPRRSRPRPRTGSPDRADHLREELGYWPSGLSTSPLPSSNGNGTQPEEDVRAFGHIVVDEAQDLSPMQLRMLARRSISGSMTVVGDIAQATGPWAPQRWEDVERHLSPSRRARVVELSVGYRTPAEVMGVAAGVLAAAAPGMRAPTPMRHSGTAPTVWRSGPAEIAERVVQAVTAELSAVAGGRVAVLAPDGMVAGLSRVLEAAGLDPVDPRRPEGPGLAAPLVVLPAAESHGLEFDSVVVVEPAAIAAGDAGEGAGEETDAGGVPVPTTAGYRALYVALTRPTRRLAVVHARELPPGLVIG